MWFVEVVFVALQVFLYVIAVKLGVGYIRFKFSDI